MQKIKMKMWPINQYINQTNLPIKNLLFMRYKGFHYFLLIS